MSIAVWEVQEYKKSVDFEQDIVEARTDRYMIDFEDCKDKVARAYLELDLSNILADGAAPEKEGDEEGEDGAVKEEIIETDKLAMRGLDPRWLWLEALRNLLPFSK